MSEHGLDLRCRVEEHTREKMEVVLSLWKCHLGSCLRLGRPRRGRMVARLWDCLCRLNRYNAFWDFGYRMLGDCSVTVFPDPYHDIYILLVHLFMRMIMRDRLEFKRCRSMLATRDHLIFVSVNKTCRFAARLSALQVS